MRDYYPDTEMEDMLQMLPDRTDQAIYSRADFLDLKKSEAYMEKKKQEWGDFLRQAGAGTRFKKGHESFNKGIPQEEWMSEESIEKTKATRFKKGDKPHNTKWDGAVTIRHSHKERGAPPYMWIRVDEGEWKQYQHYLWEEENGPIPDDKILVCKDGDTLNPHPDNWELITREENIRRNSNPEKVSRTLRKIHAGEKKPRKLTMYQAAHRLSGADADLRKYLLEHRRDLVKVALLNYKLKRKIKFANYD